MTLYESIYLLTYWQQGQHQDNNGNYY